MGIPSHWTYGEIGERLHLEQGDILEPTEQLRGILETVHPHFLDAKYVAFMVISQSCDLVRRPGYRGQPISLCVIRELNSIATTLLGLFCGTSIAGVFEAESRIDGKKFLERVVNQNEQGIGLFYLHPDADAGISVPSVAMLRISIALRTQHYDILTNARRGRLRPEFQAKLGWLVGNLYSRVGTEDWSEPESRKREQNGIVNDILDNLPVIWGSSNALDRASRAKFSSEGKTPDEIAAALKTFEPAPLNELILESLQKIIGETQLGTSPDLQRRILQRIRNDSTMSGYLNRVKKR